MLKECKYHGLTEHKQDNKGIWRCKKCNTEVVANKRQRNKLALIEYKGGKCSRCGYNKSIEALEFHHINPNEKEFSISHVGTRSLERLKKEVDKCVLLCANCHREVHAELREKRQEHLKNIVIDDEMLNKIKVLSNSKTTSEIANELNLPRTTISGALKRNNIEICRKDNPLKNYTLELFIKQYKEKQSLIQVGKLNNVTDNAIRKWLKKNSLPTDKKNIQKLIENNC